MEDFNQNSIYYKIEDFIYNIETAEKVQDIDIIDGEPIDYFGKPYSREDFINHVAKIYGYKIGLDLLTLEKAKEFKEQELSTDWRYYEQSICDAIFFTSSLGFMVNGDRRSRDNIDDLLSFFDEHATGTPKTVRFRDYNNQDQQLTKDNLVTLKKELAMNMENLYTQKWNKDNSMKNAKTIEELKGINLNYKMQDFTTNDTLKGVALGV